MRTILIAALLAVAGTSHATVEGPLLGSKFVATYAYAKKEAGENTYFVFFGNGEGGGCESTGSNETAFVGINHPGRLGTYSSNPTKAFFSGLDLEPKAFSSFKVDVKNVTANTIEGSVELISSSGKVAGDFNAAICPGTN